MDKANAPVSPPFQDELKQNEWPNYLMVTPRSYTVFGRASTLTGTTVVLAFCHELVRWLNAEQNVSTANQQAAVHKTERNNHTRVQYISYIIHNKIRRPSMSGMG